MGAIIGWVIFGLIAGAIAKLLMPGRDPGGIFVTMLLGIGGALIGGFIGRAIWGSTGVNDWSIGSFAWQLAAPFFYCSCTGCLSVAEGEQVPVQQLTAAGEQHSHESKKQARLQGTWPACHRCFSLCLLLTVGGCCPELAESPRHSRSQPARVQI